MNIPNVMAVGSSVFSAEDTRSIVLRNIYRNAARPTLIYSSMNTEVKQYSMTFEVAAHTWNIEDNLVISVALQKHWSHGKRIPVVASRVALMSTK